jgi:hypothetical protein
MNDQIVRVTNVPYEKIAQHARETAMNGLSPILCPYPKDSEAADTWRDVYYRYRKAFPGSPENHQLQRGR